MDLCQPGPFFRYRLASRATISSGHTEGMVNLMKLTGLSEAVVWCKLTNADGSMAKLKDIISFALKHDMVVLSIEDTVQYQQCSIR